METTAGAILFDNCQRGHWNRNRVWFSACLGINPQVDGDFIGHAYAHRVTRFEEMSCAGVVGGHDAHRLGQ
jgi:hypothetical protein